MKTVIGIKNPNAEFTEHGVSAVDIEKAIKDNAEIIKKIQSLVKEDNMATKLTISELIHKRQEAQDQINNIISQLESDCDGCCVKIDVSYVSSDTVQGEHRTNHVYVELVI